MGPTDRYRRAVLLILTVALAGLGMSACGGGGSSAGSSSTSDQAGAIEAELTEDVASAGATCTEKASGISSEAARKTAESACGSIQKALEENVVSAASAARGSIETGLKELAAECRSTAAGMSFGKGAALKLCEEVEELQG